MKKLISLSIGLLMMINLTTNSLATVTNKEQFTDYIVVDGNAIKLKEVNINGYKTITIGEGKNQQVVEIIPNSDIFYITDKGIREKYNRKDYTNNKLSVMQRSSIGSQVRDVLGNPYDNKYIDSREFDHNGRPKSAELSEYYNWYAYEYKSEFFKAFDTVALILAALNLGWTSIKQILGSVATVIGGVLKIKCDVTVEFNCYRQNWDRFVEVGNKGTYKASRTRCVQVYATTYGEPYEKKLDDEYDGDFFNEQLLLNTGINNYIRFN